MPDPDHSPDRIYHLALREEWQQAVDCQETYARSTLGRSLTQVGFIHCSFVAQVGKIADLIYRGRPDVLLLEIDPSLIHSEIRSENLEGGDDLFPHIYGELPPNAVVRVQPIPLHADGTLNLSGLL